MKNKRCTRVLNLFKGVDVNWYWGSVLVNLCCILSHIRYGISKLFNMRTKLADARSTG